jgi:hypothetical protein
VVTVAAVEVVDNVPVRGAPVGSKVAAVAVVPVVVAAIVRVAAVEVAVLKVVDSAVAVKVYVSRLVFPLVNKWAGAGFVKIYISLDLKKSILQRT